MEGFAGGGLDGAGVGGEIVEGDDDELPLALGGTAIDVAFAGAGAGRDGAGGLAEEIGAGHARADDLVGVGFDEVAKGVEDELAVGADDGHGLVLVGEFVPRGGR